MYARSGRTLELAERLKEDLRFKDGINDYFLVEFTLATLHRDLATITERQISKLRNPGYLLHEFCMIIPSHWPA